MKKLLVLAVLLFMPIVASAQGTNMMNKTFQSQLPCSGGYNNMMSGFGGGIVAMHVLGVVIFLVWGIVGVLACVWLWQHIETKKSHTKD